MPHLKYIGLTNFRVFGERTNIALASLTILTGPNSSGKSSVLKAIQLLQENIGDIGHLNFSHGEHKLGNFEMTLNRDATDKTMVFTLPFECKDMPEEMYMDWIYNLDTSNSLQYAKLTRLSICLKKDKHEVIGITPWGKTDIDLEYFHKNRKKANLWINILEIDLLKHLISYYEKNSRIGYYYDIADISEKPLYEKLLERMAGIEDIEGMKQLKEFNELNVKRFFFENVFSLLIKIKEELKLEFNVKNDEELTRLFEDDFFDYDKDMYDIFDYTFANSFNDYLIKFDELSKEMFVLFLVYSAERLKDNICYKFWELSKKMDINNYLNTKDNISSFYPYKELENSDNSIYTTISSMLKEAFGVEEFKKEPFKEFRKDNFYYLEAVRANTQRLYTWQTQGTAFNQLLLDFVKTNEDWQLDFINHWLKEFGIGNEFKVNINEHGIGASITIDNKPLADLGYGVTQFLPILLRICTMVQLKKIESYPEKWSFTEKKIIYIEEPETNLHPKLQSKLADMFIDASRKFNLQIIVETHSEYLIRKLQYLTAKEEITPDMTVIHYFYDPKEERPEGEPQVKQINIQTDGRLTGQFGAGFYDETARLMTAILTGETLN